MPDLELAPDDFFRDVRLIHGRLDETYPKTNLGNRDEAFEELVYIILSTRTREEYYQAAFSRLRRLVGTWDALPDIAEGILADTIREAGLSVKKARILKEIAMRLRSEYGAVSLAFLSEMSTPEAESYLVGLPGVGIKTAKCVLMYALNRPVFPLDAHCLRVGNRLGWFEAPTRRLPVGEAERIEAAVPPRLRRSLHVKLIQHGRVICVVGVPKCGKCVVGELCSYYKRSLLKKNP